MAGKIAKKEADDCVFFNNSTCLTLHELLYLHKQKIQLIKDNVYYKTAEI